MALRVAVSRRGVRQAAASLTTTASRACAVVKASEAKRISKLTQWVREPANIKVYAGDMIFWRAECVRMALFVGDVKFDDVRGREGFTRDDLLKEGKLTFGATPAVEVDGHVLSQTQAIVSYCSKVAGMHPEDAWDAAKVDEAVNGCTDVTVTIGATMKLPDDEKVAARQALIAPDGRLSLHVGGLEKILAQNGGNGRVAGAALSVADLAIWRLVGWLKSGKIDGIPQEWVGDNFPNIAALVAKVDAHPKVKEWTEKHAKHYPDYNPAKPEPAAEEAK